VVAAWSCRMWSGQRKRWSNTAEVGDWFLLVDKQQRRHDEMAEGRGEI
jgi:hypothetical protein